MRFLIGIVAGAILTLFIATAMDAPTHRALSQTGERLAGVWDQLITRTSDSLFPVIEPTAEPSAEIPDPAQLVDSEPDLLPMSVAAPAPPDYLSPFEPIDEPEFEQAFQLVDQPAEPALRFDEFVYEPPASGTEASQPSERAEPFTPPASMPDSATAVAWAPFHSQMSAEGFAAQLSRQLDHDFQVERRGAGAYQVVFNSSSPAERDLLLAQIAEVTGQ